MSTDPKGLSREAQPSRSAAPITSDLRDLVVYLRTKERRAHLTSGYGADRYAQWAAAVESAEAALVAAQKDADVRGNRGWIASNRWGKVLHFSTLDGWDVQQVIGADASETNDAARYRWLRQFPTDTQQFGRRYWGDELDAAIDAAITRGQPEDKT